MCITSVCLSTATNPNALLIRFCVAVASGAARPQAASINDLVSLFNYSDTACSELFGVEGAGTTIISAEERSHSRKAACATLRATLDRILMILYSRTFGTERTLQLEPEPKATVDEKSVANIVSLHQSGLLEREEARQLLSSVYGRELS